MRGSDDTKIHWSITKWQRKELLEMVKLFSTGCPKCKVVEAKLKQKNVSFEVESNPDAVIAKGQELGILSAPILQIDDEYFEFSKAVKVINERM